MDEKLSSWVRGLTSRDRRMALLFNLVMLVLVLAALFLPPISLGRYFVSDSFSLIDKQAWSVADPDGAELMVLPAGLPDETSLQVELTGIPRADFLSGAAGEEYQSLVQALPSYLLMKSPLYQIRLGGAAPTMATLRLPIPNDAEPLRTLDVYAWSGEKWYRLGGSVREAQDDILIRLDYLPQAVAVMQTQEMEPVLSVSLSDALPLPEKQLDALTEIYPDGGLVAEDGSILVEPSLSRSAFPGLRVIPTIRNWTDAGEVLGPRLDRILGDEKLRQAHINALRQFVAQGGYDGVDIDYRGLSPQSRAALTRFIVDLAPELQGQGKLLSVRVALPTIITPQQWDTGPYDWPALSRVIDILRAPLPPAPRAYLPGGQAHDFFDWAVREADRYKLQLIFRPLAVEQAGDEIATHSYAGALSVLTRLETVDLPETIAPGDKIFLSMPVLRRSSGLLYDETLHTWWFSYLDERHREHIVWLNNAEELSARAELAATYHLRGLGVEGLSAPGSDPDLWAALRALSSRTDAPVAEAFTLQWQTSGTGALSVKEGPLLAESADHVWTAPLTRGPYQIDILVAQDAQPLLTVESLSVQVSGAVAVVTPIITPTPSPTAQATQTAAPTATSTATPTAQATQTVAPTATSTATPTAQATKPVAPTATPTFTPAPSPTPEFLSPPILLEPESGAYFSQEVRLKWLWPRRLADNEKFAVRWESVFGDPVGDWWVDEIGIIGGGGAIHKVDDGYRFEVNFGLGPYPGGEAYWSVAVFVEKSEDEKWQVSQWSERRQIYRGSRP